MYLSGFCADYTMTCPSLIADGTTTVRGTIDTTHFNTCDSGMVSTVVFRIRKTDGSEDILCLVPYPKCPSAQQALNGQTCQCAENNGTFATYEMDFYFNETLYNGTNLGIITNCMPTVYQFTYRDCEDIRGK